MTNANCTCSTLHIHPAVPWLLTTFNCIELHGVPVINSYIQHSSELRVGWEGQYGSFVMMPAVEWLLPVFLLGFWDTLGRHRFPTSWGISSLSLPDLSGSCPDAEAMAWIWWSERFTLTKDWETWAAMALLEDLHMPRSTRESFGIRKDLGSEWLLRSWVSLNHYAFNDTLKHYRHFGSLETRSLCRHSFWSWASYSRHAAACLTEAKHIRQAAHLPTRCV